MNLTIVLCNSCVAEEVFGGCESNDKNCQKKAMFLRFCAAEFALHILKKDEYLSRLDGVVTRQIIETRPADKFKEKETFADIIHMRLIATLLATRIKVFVQFFGHWQEIIPFNVDPELVPTWSSRWIYLYHTGNPAKSIDGHFRLIKNVFMVIYGEY